MQAEQAEFINLAAHDPQAPLRKLGTFVDRLLARCKDVSEAGQYADRIQVTLSQMTESITSLSALANVGLPDHSEASLPLIITELRKDKGLSEEQLTIAPLPIIKAGKDHLKTVFSNLIDNSLKFRNSGNLSITISSDNDDTNKRLLIYYSDNGIGITPGSEAIIFKPFTRLNGARFPGPGMGLAICKKILELYNGTIYVTPLAGPGARFTISIPQP